MNKKKFRAVGLMSGTSADGIDAAVIDFYNEGKIKVLAFDTFAYPEAVRKAIFDCFDDKLSIAEISNLNFFIGELFAESVLRLCDKYKIKLSSIDVVGSHGQTVYHNPNGEKFAGRIVCSTLQIGEPCVIAQRTKILTVADFRPSDIAAGGQGAPLVPYSDFLLFADKKKTRVIQNIGGIANLTYLAKSGNPQDVIAFDTGPGNMIIDSLMQIISGGSHKFDKDGKMAMSGNADADFVKKLMRNKFFNLKPPKTTGREMFGYDFAKLFYKNIKNKKNRDCDIIATATLFTVESIVNAYKKFLPKMPDEVILCGGGSRNKALVKLLSDKLEKVKVVVMDEIGINADAKEAVSFAILAVQTIRGIPNNIPAATGAQKAIVLGKIVPV